MSRSIIVYFISFPVGTGDTYHVEKLIGTGAFAKVYLARKRGADFDPDDIEMDDESLVVLKVIFLYSYILHIVEALLCSGHCVGLQI